MKNSPGQNADTAQILTKIYEKPVTFETKVADTDLHGENRKPALLVLIDEQTVIQQQYSENEAKRSLTMTALRKLKSEFR